MLACARGDQQAVAEQLGCGCRGWQVAVVVVAWRLEGWPTSRGRALPARSPMSRWRPWWWPPWSRPLRTPGTGRGRRWPSVRGCRSPRWGGSGGVPARAAPAETFKLSSDPRFTGRVRGVVGCSWTRPSMPGAVRGRDVPGPGAGPVPPVLPMLPGVPSGAPRLRRDGITSLLAALDVASGR